jgi:hypothetical protein
LVCHAMKGSIKKGEMLEVQYLSMDLAFRDFWVTNLRVAPLINLFSIGTSHPS